MGARTTRLLAAALLAVACAVPVSAQETGVTRVGVVSFQTWGERVEALERYFARVAKAGAPIELTFGTYDEILHWFRKGWIDAAVVTPGVYAQLLALRGRPAEVPPFRYLGTRGPRHFYRSVAVVHEKSPLRSLEELASADDPELLFVHRLSAAGFIVPDLTLRGLGVVRYREKYTFSHTESLRRLLEAPPSEPRVAFVWDGALHATKGGLADEDHARLRVLGSTWLPPDSPTMIPEDALIVRADRRTEAFEKAVRKVNAKSSDLGFAPIEATEHLYAGLLPSTAVPRDPDAMHLGLDEIGWMLRGYREGHDQRNPRLAVVLSGGGAKCAYQVGVLGALEMALQRSGVSIDLVVGTSGGAINAVPAAMGMFADEPGRARVEELWKNLDQRDIVRVSLAGQLIHGIWIALVGYAIASLISRRAGRAEPVVLGSVLCGLGVLNLWIGYSDASPWRWLGDNHLLHHLFLYGSVGAPWSGWALVVLGVGRLARGHAASLVPRESRAALVGRAFLWLGVFGLPPVQAINLLFVQETLITEESIEHLVADSYADLLDDHERNGSPQERIRRYSEKILGGDSLGRDLVITASRLDGGSDTLVSDLYFYAAAGDTEPGYGQQQGVSLRDPRYSGFLLDAVMGSASIYPLFPAREVRDFPVPYESVLLVDGGFAHNSPIEAAVDWGATHVIVIEATPEDPRSARGGLLRNAMGAVDHLHRQAQLIDARSKEDVVVLTIAPELPHIDVLDFSDNLIEATIRKGEREARRGSSGHPGTPRFRRELGKPRFWNPRS